jgi:hypothetical protein
MHFFFDESGDYAFLGGVFDCYVQAALICPDDSLQPLKEFVENCKAVWRAPELHASELSLEHLQDVATFIGESECQLLVQVTDTVLITADQIAQFRLDQAATLKSNLEWYQRESTKARGAPDGETVEWMLRQIKRAGLASQISHGEFIQARFLLELVADSLQKSLYYFQDDRWRDDFRDFRFVVDGKLPNKLASGEKYFSESIVPSLGSRRGVTLGVPETWHQDPIHPFVGKFRREQGRVRGEDVKGVIDLDGIFGHGIRFDESVDSPGVQLVDTVAYVTRRAVMEPGNSEIQAAFDSFRGKLRNGNEKCLTIQRLRVGEEDRSSLGRYRALYGPDRIG